MKSVARKDRNTAVVEETTQIVTFQVGGEEYGLDIKSITEVIRPLKITPLPRMPEFIEGVINLRGVIIPIVDLRKRFSLAKTAGNPRTMRMVITRGAFIADAGRSKELLGLLVDVVNEVLHVPLKDIEPAPAAATGQHAEFITGMGKVGDRLIIFLDITRILSRQERSALAEAGRGEAGTSGT
jgi:purine-binding chemotaxis protein CheW